ncbi:hypothetical protein [Nostoc sp. ChiVER01]|uniref:hypothetical protein n=1 Tax=Nostoc sp. ChiVER01 TaxID=3075382 RepID=UPI002AD285A2|nr:hypothetical protein [Nostoc sp. ChiVER01]
MSVVRLSGLALLAREFILWQKSGQVQEYKSELYCYISYEFMSNGRFISADL